MFRADGDTVTGLGHLYRLFALVEVVRNTFDFIFVSRSTSISDIIPKEYPFQIIDTEVSLLEEPKWLSEKFSPEEYILIADGYQFKSKYQKSIKEQGYKMVYIDDLEEYHMYADLVINHSSLAKTSNFKAETYTKFALGTQYSLLRPAFLEKAKSKREASKIDTVFICFGGGDKYDLSFKAAKALLSLDFIKEVKLVVGAANKNKNIKALQNAYPTRLLVYKNLSEKKLSEVMQSCNFAISPTSTILYELVCIKMPIVSGYFVENQKAVYSWFNSKNCFYGVDDFTKFDFDQLQVILEKMNHLTVIEKYINIQSSIIDGEQSGRLLKVIGELVDG